LERCLRLDGRVHIDVRESLFPPFAGTEQLRQIVRGAPLAGYYMFLVVASRTASHLKDHAATWGHQRGRNLGSLLHVPSGRFRGSERECYPCYARTSGLHMNNSIAVSRLAFTVDLARAPCGLPGRLP
jgi:hypothetical protein